MPSTWQECKEIRDSQDWEEEQRYSKALGKLYDRRYELIVESEEIYSSEKADIYDECDARIDAAKKKAAAVVAA